MVNSEMSSVDSVRHLVYPRWKCRIVPYFCTPYHQLNFYKNIFFLFICRLENISVCKCTNIGYIFAISNKYLIYNFQLSFMWSYIKYFVKFLSEILIEYLVIERTIFFGFSYQKLPSLTCVLHYIFTAHLNIFFGLKHFFNWIILFVGYLPM